MEIAWLGDLIEDVRVEEPPTADKSNRTKGFMILSGDLGV
jgi:hypothetical protein